MGDLVEPGPARASAIAEEIALGGVEEGHARDPPVARRGAAAGDAEAGVAERRPFLERARRLAVDPILAAFGDRGDALADQRAARRALDPEDHPVGAGLPLELLDRSGLGRFGGRHRVAAAAEILDSGDKVANLGLAAFGRRAELLSGRGGDLAAEREIAGAEAGESVDDVGGQVAAVAKQAAGDRPEARQQVEPFVRAEPGAAEQRRGDCGQILGEEGERGRG